MEELKKIKDSLVNIVSQDVVDILANESFCPCALKSDYLEFYENSECKELTLSPEDFNSTIDALCREEGSANVMAELAKGIKILLVKNELLKSLAYFANWYEVGKWAVCKSVFEIADAYADVWQNCLAFSESGYPKEVLKPNVFEEKLFFLYARGGDLK